LQRKIDLVKAMKIFVAVVDAKSFSGASGKLNLATSAISKNVSDLEDYYDCKLLNRNTRNMHLTSEGQHFLDEFKRILAQLNELKTGVSTRKNKIAGDLKITSPENAQGLGFDKKISDFILQYPDVNVIWHQQNRHTNIVEEGIDVAIRIGKLEDSNLIVQKISQVDNLIVASPTYLKKYGVPSHPSDLSHFPCIIEISNAHPWSWPYIENNLQNNVAVSGKVKLNKGETVAYFAVKGHGIARLPRFMMQEYLERGELIPILESYYTEPLDISLVYPKNSQNNVVLSTFIKYIR